MLDVACKSATPTAAGTAQRVRILCVDDEPNVLASLRLVLREYEVHTATSGSQGLEIIDSLAPLPVVISDMRMPQMSGAQFLQEVAERHPSTTRVLLTGASDMEAAVDAVNLGNLFRFLLKPCPADQLRATIKAAIAHHTTLISERDLLQNTLVGSMHALTELLGIADPIAFGRIGRLKELALAVARQLKVEPLWPIEYAALVCQLGNISLPAPLARKLYRGLPTTVQERIQIDAAVKLAPGIIRHIPRLEPVSEILDDLASARPGNLNKLRPGARILRLVLAYEAIERTSKNQTTALRLLQQRASEFDVPSVNALLQTLGAAPLESEGMQTIPLAQIRPGMCTAFELRSLMGVLIVPAGVVFTESLIARLSNFPEGYLPAYLTVRRSNS